MYITRTGTLTIKVNILLVFLVCFSTIIPARGSVMGLTWPRVLLVTFIMTFLYTRQRVQKLPYFMLVYGASVIITIMAHFFDRTVMGHVYELLAIFGEIYIVLACIKTKDDFDKLLNYIVKIFAVYAIFGIIESLFRFNIFDFLTNTEVIYTGANGIRFGFARSRGAFSESINNGLVLGLVLCLTNYKIINERKKWYYVSYILVLINAVFTMSRGIWMSILISQIILFLGLKKEIKVRVIFKAIIAFIVLYALSGIILSDDSNNIIYIVRQMFTSVIDILTGRKSSTMSGLGNRLELFDWVFKSVKNNLTYGMGFKQQFSYKVTDYFIKESIEISWLSVIYKTGLVGLAGYLVFQAGSLLYFFKNAINRFKYKEVINFNYIMLAASIGYTMAQFSCATGEDLRFYYVLLALTFSYNKIYLKKRDMVKDEE